MSELDRLALAWEINGAEITLSFFRISRNGGNPEGAEKQSADAFNCGAALITLLSSYPACFSF